MNADDIGNLVKTIGGVAIAFIPIIVTIFKVDPEKVGPLTAQITQLVGAIALAAVALAGLWIHNNHVTNTQAQKIAAVQALTSVAPEHKEERAKFLGVAPK